MVRKKNSSIALLGAAIGLLFAFGLSVTAALYCTSFATAVLNAAGITGRWQITGLSIGTLVLILLVNVAGVKWVIRFQILLAIILAAAAIDFIVGPWVPDKDGSRQAQGFWGYNQERLYDSVNMIAIKLKTNEKFTFLI